MSLIDRHRHGLAIAAGVLLALAVSAGLLVAYGEAVRVEAGHVLVARTLDEAEAELGGIGEAESFAELVKGAQSEETSVLLFLKSDVAARYPAYTRALAGALDEVHAAHEAWAAAEEAQRGSARPSEVDQHLEAARVRLAGARRIVDAIHPEGHGYLPESSALK